jgi:hypothetical protein
MFQRFCPVGSGRGRPKRCRNGVMWRRNWPLCTARSRPKWKLALMQRSRSCGFGCPRPICGRPPPRKVFCSGFDRIACVHMSGLSMRSHMNAGQDGFRDEGSKHQGDLSRGHWVYRSVPRRGSIDHTICSLSCKFWASAQHGCSSVAPRVWPISRPRLPRQRARISRCKFPRSASSSRRCAPSCWPASRRPTSATCA